MLVRSHGMFSCLFRLHACQVSFEVLVSLERRLRGLVEVEVEEAEKVEDWPRVLKFCLLFPLLNLPHRGLATYCSVVRRSLAINLQKQGMPTLVRCAVPAPSPLPIV